MSEEVEAHVLERYELIQKVGKGAYGIVWKARDKQTNAMVALKKIYDAFQNSTDAQRTYREVMYLRQLSGHENIIKLLSIMHANNNKDLYLVFELMETDLHVVIRAKILKLAHKKYIMYQLFKALKYLHSANLVHRDLKPSNMLINSDCLIKIADFGLARSIALDEEGETPIVSDYIVTRWYRAPEILLGSKRYSLSVDVWSAGCIMAEVLLEKVLFPGKSSVNQLEIIIDLLGRPTQTELSVMNIPSASTVLNSISNKKCKSFAEQFGNCPPEAIDLLRKMLIFNPLDRPSIEEILEHPFFEKFHCPAKEPKITQIITIPIDDNMKYPHSAYRDALYKFSPSLKKRTLDASPTNIVRKPKEKKLSRSPEVISSKGTNVLKKIFAETQFYSINTVSSKENRSPAASKTKSYTILDSRKTSSVSKSPQSKMSYTSKLTDYQTKFSTNKLGGSPMNWATSKIVHRSPELKKREAVIGKIPSKVLFRSPDKIPNFSVTKVDSYYFLKK